MHAGVLSEQFGAVGVSPVRVEIKRKLQLGFRGESVTLPEQPHAAKPMSDHPPGFVSLMFCAREEQIREGFGFLNLSAAIRVRELAEDEWERHRRSSRFATKLQSALAAPEELRRGGASGDVYRADKRRLQVDLEVPSQVLVPILSRSARPFLKWSMASRWADCLAECSPAASQLLTASVKAPASVR